MTDGEILDKLERIARSIERLADKWAPEADHREKRPATLTTATYNREERERNRLKEAFKRPPQRTSEEA